MHIFNAKSQIDDTYSETNAAHEANWGLKWHLWRHTGLGGTEVGVDTPPSVHVEPCVCPGLQCVVVLVQEVASKIAAYGGTLPLYDPT